MSNFIQILDFAIDATRKRLAALRALRDALTSPKQRTSELKPGATLSDGTVYAGHSPDNGAPLYVMPEDLKPSVNWFGAKKARTVYGGYADWRLPTATELNLLFENQHMIGNFVVDWYWSVDEDTEAYAHVQHFSNGYCTSHFKNLVNRVRLVRSG